MSAPLLPCLPHTWWCPTLAWLSCRLGFIAATDRSGTALTLLPACLELRPQPAYKPGERRFTGSSGTILKLMWVSVHSQNRSPCNYEPHRTGMWIYRDLFPYGNHPRETFMAMRFPLSVLLLASIRHGTWGPKSGMATYIWIMFFKSKVEKSYWSEAVGCWCTLTVRLLLNPCRSPHAQLPYTS